MHPLIFSNKTGFYTNRKRKKNKKEKLKFPPEATIKSRESPLDVMYSKNHKAIRTFRE